MSDDYIPRSRPKSGFIRATPIGHERVRYIPKKCRDRDPNTRCPSCGTILRKTNPGPLCSPCESRGVKAA